MTSLISAFFPSYVRSASCYTSQINNLQLLPVDFPEIGRKHHLRITGIITPYPRPKGICEGFSLIFIAYCLRQSLAAPSLLPRLETIRKHILSRHPLECFLLQKLQNNLLGMDGKPDPKILAEWQTAISEIAASIPQADIRSYLLNLCETSQPFSPDLYATILEIEGLYQARINPGAHRFHNLEMDVLHELLSLLGVKSHADTHFRGTIEDLIRELNILQKGVYHLSLRGHGLVYIVDDSGNRVVCDVNFGIKHFRSSQQDQVKKEFRPYLRSKPQWMTISRCALI